MKKPGPKAIIRALMEQLAEFTGENVHYAQTDPKHAVNIKAIETMKTAKEYLERKPAKRMAAKRPNATVEILRTAGEDETVAFKNANGDTLFEATLYAGANILRVTSQTGRIAIDPEDRSTVELIGVIPAELVKISTGRNEG